MIRICGLDEVGRGAFAGPLVAAAVVIKGSITDLINGCPVPIRDSKTLTHSQRLRIKEYLAGKKVKSLIESIEVSEINQKGMGWANKEIFIRLISKMKASRYVVDGNLKLGLNDDLKVKSLIKADGKVPQVMLASILAKLHRDDLMSQLHKQFPNYDWKNNKGYGTLKHRQMITQFGACQQHRELWIKTWQSHKNSDTK